MALPEILLIEPFYGGSHKVLIDLIKSELEKQYTEEDVCMVTMTAKKWHWRARTSSLYLAERIPKNHGFRVIFCSSVMNLAELIALRQDLGKSKKIIYFHENQLIYPVQLKKERDFQYGYNEVLSCLVADLVIFNSQFNRNSFLNNLNIHFRLQPDYRPRNLKERIAVKSEVLYFPVPYQRISTNKNYNGSLHIVWPHRWEHDKGLDEFIEILQRLAKENVDYIVSLLGEQADIDEKYENIRLELGDHVKHWGFIENKADYKNVLAEAHIAVSTATHEFFGVSMMECIMQGCYPLCPNRLVYPELYPKECLYDTSDDLFDKLANFSRDKYVLQQKTHNLKIDYSSYTVENMLPKYINLFVT